ncbi:hypothetical protein [Palaeococcus ferrophilus]|uniref:hypothetical protein n=1 Tax=Palaeococcus ferrophilus TaxID=83868 RepID=UPI00064E7A69|nr:hypothetical protein [Palaeococcus ferrophilus]
MDIKKVIGIGLVFVLLLSVSIYAVSTKDNKEILESTLKVETPTIPSPVAVDNALLEATVNRAEYLISQAQSTTLNDREIQRVMQSAIKKLEISKSEKDSWRALISAREASVEATTVIAYTQAKEGELSEKDVLNEVPNWGSKIQLLKARLKYNGENLEQSLIITAEVERSLESAENWLSQAQEILNLNNRPRELRIAYSLGALEAVRGNLEDAEFLLNSLQKDGTGQEGNIMEIYTRFNKEVMLKLNTSTYPKESFANLTLREAKGVIKRAESRFDKGFRASATIDVIHAFVLAESLDTLSKVPDPWYANATITAGDIYQAKKQAVQALNEAIKNANGNVLSLYLLRFVDSEIKTADSLVKRSIESERFENTEALRLAYALYIRAASYAKNINKVVGLVQG